jgi:DNA-binding response OmpR family regulator
LRAAAANSDLVLVVDDDQKIAALVEMYLSRAGYRVAVANDGIAAVRLLREMEPDLVVLDLMLPELDGMAVARVAREEARVPIVMLSALGSTRDRVAGLEGGADDYVAKPFAPQELVARVRSVLRRARRPAPSGVLRRGRLSVDLERREVVVAGAAIDLSAAEFELLAAIIEGDGRVLTRQQLIDRIRPFGEGIQDRSIDVYVGRLRTKLRDDPARSRFVVTARGVGYRLGPC